MKPRDAAESFAALFPAIYLRFHRRDSTSDVQLTNRSLAVLKHLAATGPLTVAEAAAHFGRSQAATSELVRRLVRRGLLARLCDERDRRRSLLWLTTAGQKALDTAQQVLSVDLLHQAMRAMSAAERKTLITAVRRLLNDGVKKS